MFYDLTNLLHVINLMHGTNFNCLSSCYCNASFSVLVPFCFGWNFQIFGEFGVKKFDPIGDRYNSNHHLVIDEVDDATKEPHTIVNVVKVSSVLSDCCMYTQEFLLACAVYLCFSAIFLCVDAG